MKDRNLKSLVTIFTITLIFFIGVMGVSWWFGGSVSARLDAMEAERLARLSGSGATAGSEVLRGADGQVLGEVLQAVDGEGGLREGADGSGSDAGSRSSGATPSGRFLVNVPSEFNSTVRVQGREILRDLLEGSGIQLVGDEGAPQIVNADPGSAQNIFKVIDINGETLTADSNESVLSFEAGEGLEVSVQNGRIVISTAAGSADSEDSGEDAGDTINNVTNVTEVTQVVDGGGFERNTADGNVALQTNTDTVSIGTEVAQGKLTVISTDTSQTGLAVQATPGQTAALADFKGADGESLITFDPEGNAVFKGNITQTGNTRIIGGGLTFNSTDPIVFDGVGDEPGNILENPGLEGDLDGWTASTPTLVNQISNPDFDSTDKLSGWSSETTGASYPEEFTNGGFEMDLSVWDIEGGGLYTITEYGPTSNNPHGITTGPDGNLWYTSFGGHKIGRITTTGVITEYGPTSNNPRGITTGPDGNLWYTSFGGNKIGRITTTGVITEYGPTSNTPWGITTGPDGNLWYTSFGGHKIGRLQLAGPERVTTPTYSFSSGAIKLPATGSPLQITQSLNLPATNTYTLEAYAYRGLLQPVTDADVVLEVNGTPITTTYTAVGADWYRLSATVAGSDASTSYGVQVADGKTVYVDNISFKQVAGASHQITPFNDGFGASQIAVPSSATTNFTTTRPLIPGNYTFSIYAYTDGSPMTTADAELVFNGSTIPTSISAGSKAGWYEFAGAFTVNSEGSYPVGIQAKSGKTVYVDDASLTIASVGTTTAHVTKENPITYNDTEGAVQVNAIGTSDITFTQEVEVPTDGPYSFLARVYDNTPGNVGADIDATKVGLTINGVPATATFSTAGGGWWSAQTDTTLTAGTYTVGVTVKSGNKLVLDNIALQAGSGTDRTFRIVNSGTGLAFLDVESTIFANSGKTNKSALVITSADQQTANLIEWKDFDGNVLGVVDENGGMGIGTSNPSGALSVLDEKDSGQVVSFVNTSSTDSPLNGVLRIGTAVDSTSTDARFIQFYAGATTDSNGTGVGKIRLNNSGVAFESGGADFAEYFASARPGEQYEPGDVVALGSTGRADTTVKAYHPGTLGVVSNTAAFVGNARPETEATGSAHVLVGIQGQIEVKVATVGGVIRAGDPLTTSSVEGHAMKATAPGMVLGTALEDYTASESGTLKAYINPSWRGYGEVFGIASASPGAELGIVPLEGTVGGGNTSTFSGSTTLDGTTVLEGLTVAGPTNLYDTSITGDLSVGLLTIRGLGTTGSEGQANSAGTSDPNTSDPTTAGTTSNASQTSISQTTAPAIDTITGALLLQSQAQGAIELMGGKTTIDRIGSIILKEGDVELKQGTIRGNTTFSGTITMKEGSQTYEITRSWETAPISVVITSDNPAVTGAVQKLGIDGFTIVTEQSVNEEVQFYWLAIF